MKIWIVQQLKTHKRYDPSTDTTFPEVRTLVGAYRSYEQAKQIEIERLRHIFKSHEGKCIKQQFQDWGITHLRAGMSLVLRKLNIEINIRWEQHNWGSSQVLASLIVPNKFNAEDEHLIEFRNSIAESFFGINIITIDNIELHG